jgi:hypothetical protein
MSELANRGGDIPGMDSGAKEKAERDALWVGEWADELTVAIALREWEKAVTLVEQGKSSGALCHSRPHTGPLCQAKLNSQLHPFSVTNWLR